MGEADYLALGDWNAVCYRCGRKQKASTMRKQWQGYWVCAKHWEARPAQDFVRGIPDNMSVPWQQPPAQDNYIYFQNQVATCDIAIADNAVCDVTLADTL